MNPKNRKNKRNWSWDELLNKPNRRPKCQHCHGTKTCQRCMGDGCMSCDYLGRCQHCIMDPEEA